MSALGALGVQFVASVAGCVPLKSDTDTRLGRIGLTAGSCEICAQGTTKARSDIGICVYTQTHLLLEYNLDGAFLCGDCTLA